MTIGEIIARLRDEAGLTQAELAELAGKTQSRVSNLETGRISNPHWNTVVDLAEACDHEVVFVPTDDERTMT